MSLEGKAALVTGSTSESVSRSPRPLRPRAAGVMLNGLGDRDAIECTARRHRPQGRRQGRVQRADMSKPAEIADLVADAQAKLGGIDILVNNAGIQHVARGSQLVGGQVWMPHRHVLDAGVVHQNVDAAQLRLRVGHEVGDLRGLAHVGGVVRDLTPALWPMPSRSASIASRSPSPFSITPQPSAAKAWATARPIPLVDP